MIFIGLLLFVNQVFSQSTQLNSQIKQVENNIIPYVLVKGFKSWNIIDRMKYYNVPGVSVVLQLSKTTKSLGRKAMV